MTFDWSTQTAQLVEVREEWKYCTTGHGVQSVMIHGQTMTPELRAGIYDSIISVFKYH